MTMRIWPVVRRIWIVSGLTATVIFVTWSLLAYRATGEGRRALESDARVTVTHGNGYWSFRPAVVASTGLIFFPGALVDPIAYAPLVHAVAVSGFPAILIEVPWRGALGGADAPAVLDRAMAASASSGARRWVVAGHSRGGVIAARVARDGFPGLVGVVLIGTSHPRDFSLAATPIAVTQVFGTRDTVADVEKIERNRGNLPPATRLVRIDGGNHSQFGYYGFQPGDWPATITRGEQQRLTLQAILDTINQVAVK
jgi:pimeloyl-ACP methyl ester carboxylesterase